MHAIVQEQPQNNQTDKESNGALEYIDMTALRRKDQNTRSEGRYVTGSSRKSLSPLLFFLVLDPLSNLMNEQGHGISLSILNDMLINEQGQG